MKLIIGVLVLLVLVSSIVWSYDVIRFSGRVVSEPNAMDFCMKQLSENCDKSDYLDNERGNPKDCKLIEIFDLEYYTGCRLENDWKYCYDYSNIPFCLEAGAD